jgi:allophanate hydrolase subunit 2
LLDELPQSALPAVGETVTLDIVAGPRTDWFTADALARLTAQDWLVTPQSNRIGLRLAGEQQLERRQHQELPSEGTCSGSIQVPASGQPVLFLHDHPLTGGYPVIAAVAEYHLDLAGQIPPGAAIRFNIIQPFIEITGSNARDHLAA